MFDEISVLRTDCGPEYSGCRHLRKIVGDRLIIVKAGGDETALDSRGTITRPPFDPWGTIPSSGDLWDIDGRRRKPVRLIALRGTGVGDVRIVKMAIRTEATNPFTYLPAPNGVSCRKTRPDSECDVTGQQSFHIGFLNIWKWWWRRRRYFQNHKSLKLGKQSWSSVEDHLLLVCGPLPDQFQFPCHRLKPGLHQQQCRSNVPFCCQKRQQCRTSFALKFRPFDKGERCFDIVAQTVDIVEATGNKVACCFDNVASTSLLVWTGFYSHLVKLEHCDCSLVQRERSRWRLEWASTTLILSIIATHVVCFPGRQYDEADDNSSCRRALPVISNAPLPRRSSSVWHIATDEDDPWTSNSQYVCLSLMTVGAQRPCAGNPRYPDDPGILTCDFHPCLDILSIVDER